MVKMLIAGASTSTRRARRAHGAHICKRLGDTAIVQLLEKAGAVEGNPAGADAEIHARRIRACGGGARLPLLQKTDETFMKKSACVSCHNNSLPAMTVSLARSTGIPVDETIAKKQAKVIGAYVDNWRDRVLQGIGIPGDNDTISYILLGLAAENIRRTLRLTRWRTSSAIADRRRASGCRSPTGRRSRSSIITATALTMRALKAYAPANERDA